MLVDETLQEMRRTGCAVLADDPKARAWLTQALPDVVRGDRLLAVVLGGARVFVYHNGVPTGRSLDPTLARGFAGIWLGPQSRVPQLRAGAGS